MERRRRAEYLTRGERNIAWIEHFCRVPAGDQRGPKVRLTQEQRDLVRAIYDDGAAVQAPLTGELGAALALLHTAGFEALVDAGRLPVEVEPLHLVERGWRQPTPGAAA